MAMDLKQLEYFVRVAELGSFTKAADLLGIAQSALSRQVRGLELELRQSLLIRNGRGVVPTEAGKILLEHAIGILHQVIRAREELDKARGAVSGRVALGLPPSMTKLLTVPLTQEFRRRLPDASLSISEALSMTTHEWLLMGRLDISLIYNPSYSPDLETIDLIEEDLHLIRPKTDGEWPETIDLKALSELPLIMPVRPNALRMLTETYMSKMNFKPKIVLEIDGITALLDLVKAGLGFGVLPKYSLKGSGLGGQFTAQRISGLTSRLVIATAANRPKTPTQEAMVALIRELAPRILEDRSV
jgi:LysR family nitrogen assimilation transcriptional regulator